MFIDLSIMVIGDPPARIGQFFRDLPGDFIQGAFSENHSRTFAGEDNVSGLLGDFFLGLTAAVGVGRPSAPIPATGVK